MSSTDDRIVKMQFDNAQFKRGAAETKQSLADVNNSLDKTGSNKGLMDLNKNMDSVRVHASKMSIAVGASIATISSRLTNAAFSLAKSIAIDPITDGFHEYESLLTRQKVIMNATGESAMDVKKTLRELNNYSDKTIYKFGNMADAVQKFTNAGVPLDRAVVSIKGIANAAAYAGANSEEANRAMYAFAQSMSLGFIQLQDWNQIENANLGTIKFKNELLKAGVAAGTLTKKGKEYVTQSGKTVTATKGWRDGLHEQWATTEVLNVALGKYADKNTKLGREAFNSAQKVRTFTAFIDTLKESIGSGFAQVFQNLIGGLRYSTFLWTHLSLAVGNVTGKFFKFWATMLGTWRAMGGLDKTIQTVKNVFSPFVAIVKVFAKAWREAFPKTDRNAGAGLYKISSAIEIMTRPLTWLAKLISGTTPVLKFFFQVIGIGAKIISNSVGYIIDFVKALVGLVEMPAAPSSGGILGFIKKIVHTIGEAVDTVSDLLGKGKSLTQAFGAINIPLPHLPDISKLSLPNIKLPKLDLGGLFGGGGGDQAAGVTKTAAATSALGRAMDFMSSKSDEAAASGMFDKATSAASKVLDRTVDTMGGATDHASTVFDKLKSIGGGILDFAGNIKDKIAGFISGISVQDIVSAFNLAALSTFVYEIIKMFRAFNMVMDGLAGGLSIGKTFNETLEKVGGGIDRFSKAAKMNAWANVLRSIAISIGIFAAALLVLSFIPADKLKTGLAALGTVMALTTGTFWMMSKAIDGMDGEKMASKMIAISVALIAMGAAMILFAIALRIMAKVSWKDMAKGMATLGAAVASVVAIGKFAAEGAKSIIAAGAAILLISGALIVMAGAFMLFKLVDWGSMAKAGAAIGAIAAVVGLLALLPAPALFAVGAAMLAVAGAINIIVPALIAMALVKWSSIGKLAVVLLSLNLAVGALVAGPGLLLAGAGLVMIATALLMLNGVDWSSIGKMVLILAAVGVAIGIIGAISLVAAPGLMLLGAAFILIGAGLLAIGGGVALFAAGLTAAVALGGAAGAAMMAIALGAVAAIAAFLKALALEAPQMKDSFLLILQTLIDTIVEAVPMIVKGIKDLWNAVMDELGGGGSGKAIKGAQMKSTGQSWISKVADGIKEKLPAIVKKAAEIFIAFLNGLSSKAKDIAAAGVELIVNLIDGVASKAKDLVNAGVNLVIKIAEGIGNSLSKLIDAGIDLIVDFLHGLAEKIRTRSGDVAAAVSDVVSAMFEVGQNFGNAIKDGILNALKNIGGSIASSVGNGAKSLGGAAIHALPGLKTIAGKGGGGIFDGLTKSDFKKVEVSYASVIVSIASSMTGYITAANELLSKAIQSMDEKAKKAMGTAQGLQAAADRAEAAANKTKSKADDRAAARLSRQAERQQKEADAQQAKVDAAKAKQDRQAEFTKADLAGKAKMKSEDAQAKLEQIKIAEQKRAADLAEAAALEKQSKAEGLTKEQRKAMRDEVKQLREDADKQAQRAKDLTKGARADAAAALQYQKKAGAEAAKAFQAQFEAEKKAAEDQAAFEKMSDAEKAKKRRDDAARLQAQADKDLAAAKKLAYTDIDAANALAQVALQEAEAARQAMTDALGYDGGNPNAGSVLNLDPFAEALAAFTDYSSLFDAATAAAAATQTVEFNQYNTSPESLSTAEIYRQSNNLFTRAVDALAP